ncbi:MAG: LacI family DNA-binding transcriptional regulator [Chloroflexota bacterium]|nr:LacI family DNA-binding transcriptional regulator [Chloroflexota bacterium]
MDYDYLFMLDPEIADVAGVSVATVSRSLTGSNPPLSEETKQRIIKLAQEMGYHPNLFARGLRAKHSSMVGIIVDNISSNFAPLIVRGIQDHLLTAGHRQEWYDCACCPPNIVRLFASLGNYIYATSPCDWRCRLNESMRIRRYV